MNEMLDGQLLPLRQKIDQLDAQILALLNQRAQIAQSVGDIKAKAGAPVFRPEREAQVIDQLTRGNQGPLGTPAVRAIYREVIAACRDLERPMVVAFLGPAGTYSELAVMRQFGNSVERLPCASIDEVFRCVEAGSAQLGVVPIENSTEGAIGRTLDLLLHTPLSISGDVALKIEHHLLTVSGTLDGVTRVAAHPQALAQCARWLLGHVPQMEQLAVQSNGAAASMAQADHGTAAIAGEHAAVLYGLTPAARHIQDDPQNTTRFAIIGADPAKPSGTDRTSLILSVPNRAGAVHEMLAPLAAHGVSMTRFESRPARNGMWTYYFYIDLEGHRDDGPVDAALRELQARAGFFKVLGSYPITPGNSQ